MPRYRVEPTVPGGRHIPVGDAGAGAFGKRPRHVVRRPAFVFVLLVGLVATVLPGVAQAARPRPLVIPTITGMSPSSGPVGSPVTITGTGFTGATSVTFKGRAATFSVKTPKKITTSVPAATSTGPVVVVTPGGTATSASLFTVTLGISVDASSGPPGTTLSVAGSVFGAREAVDLYFDATDVALASADSFGNFTRINLPVPVSAAPGDHWITAVGRHSGLTAHLPFLVQTDWPQFHDSATHRGQNSSENVLSPSTIPGIDLDWSVAALSEVFASPAVVNGVVYIGSDDSSVYAFNASTGTRIWSYATGASVYSSPAVVNGVVYIGSFDRNVYALNASTGAKLWSYTTGDLVYSSPAVVNGVVYVGSFDGNVYALNASTGAKLWAYATGTEIFSSPAVANGIVYIGSTDGSLYALTASTGAKLWAYATGMGIVGSPTVANGVVYIGSGDKNVYALNASTGAKLWAYAAQDEVASAPAVVNGVVYVGSTDGNLYALNALTGAKAWAYTTGGSVNSPPAVANGVVYVGSEDARVYAFNAASGAPLWSYVTNGTVAGSPAIANGIVYVGSVDGSLYAFGLAGGMNSISRPNPATLRPDLDLHAQRGNRRDGER